MNYSLRMDVRQTVEFAQWLRNLRDLSAMARILIRIKRLELGNFGDAKFFSGIGELRIDYGPGYRVYFLRRGTEVVVLLCGGDKKRQQRDIAEAVRLAKGIEDDG